MADVDSILPGALVYPDELLVQTPAPNAGGELPMSGQKESEQREDYKHVIEKVLRIRAKVVEAILWKEPEKLKPLLRQVQTLHDDKKTKFDKRVLLMTGIHRLFHDDFWPEDCKTEADPESLGG